MAVTFVKNVGSATFNMATSGAVTVPAAGVASGNFLIARFTEDAGTGDPTITDTGSNTWTRKRDQVSNGSGTFQTVWVSILSTALSSGNTITVTCDKTGGSLIVDEWASVASVTEDVSGNTTGSSTTPASGSATPTGVGLVFATISWDSGRNQTGSDSDTNGGVGWTELTSVQQAGDTNVGAYKIATSAAAQEWNVTINDTGSFVGYLAAFDEESAAATSLPHRPPNRLHYLRR